MIASITVNLRRFSAQCHGFCHTIPLFGLGRLIGAFGGSQGIRHSLSWVAQDQHKLERHWFIYSIYWQHPRHATGVYFDSDGAIDYEGSKRSWETLTYPIPTRVSDSNAPSYVQIRALRPP